MGSTSVRDAVLASLCQGDRRPLAGVPEDDAWQFIAAEDLAGLLQGRVAAGAADRWQARLAMAARLAATVEVIRQQEIVRVLDHFAALGLSPVLVKGTPLAYSVYDAPHERPRADTDLVLPRADADRARHGLAGLGYHEPAFCEELHHQVQVERVDGGRIRHVWDLHWRVSAHAVFADLLTYEELAAEAVPIPALGAGARAAGTVHALLLACVHPVMHHRNAVRVLWLADVDRLIARLTPAERQRFVVMAIDKRVAAVVAHTLGLARETMETPVPEWMFEQLASIRGERSARYLAPHRRWLDEVADSLLATSAWRERAHLLRQMAFPSAGYMRARFGHQSSAAAVLPLLYARRLLHGGWRAVTNRK